MGPLGALFDLPQAGNLEGAAHIVQLALTPVFLLSAEAGLLNVFAARLGRVADQTDRLANNPEAPSRRSRLRVLRWRTTCLDWAVVFAALGGALTCGAVLVLFLGAVGVPHAANLLFLLFGGAVLVTMFALAAFVVEMLMAASGVRRLVSRTMHDEKVLS